MTTAIYNHGYAGWNSGSINPSNKGGHLSSFRADANGVGFASNTSVEDVDVITSGGEIHTSGNTQCNIAVACCVEKEITITEGRVLFALCVTKECTNARSRVEAACSSVKERLNTIARVGPAGGIFIERFKTAGRIIAGVVVNERMSTICRVQAAGSFTRARERLKADSRVCRG